MWEADPESLVDRLIMDNDDCIMPIPDLETQPHLLISKVRKHYMEYIIKLLSVNYENHQKLINKNIYLPSAIWRCAKSIELQAAQSCMVAQIYRRNILNVVKQLKNDNKSGKLYRNLYDCLNKAPENEKKLQVNFTKSTECTCQCTCKQRKKRRVTMPDSTHKDPIDTTVDQDFLPDITNESEELHKIPVILNNQVLQEHTFPVQVPTVTAQKSNDFASKDKYFANETNCDSPKTCTITKETQSSDDLMIQLEKLFHADPTDDDIFDSVLGNSIDHFNVFDDKMKQTKETVDTYSVSTNQKQDSFDEVHTTQVPSLDERLASLSGLLVPNIDTATTNSNQTIAQKPLEKDKIKRRSHKWVCQEYFLKSRLYELLDKIGDSNRKKLERVKDILYELFGEDSDDEGMLSPLEETPEFVASCKERIAPWIVKLLTPYYIRGRIRGKALFKSLAKHLITLIYQCSWYPSETEVNSFVLDFLQNHKMIRCEADFKTFVIDNI